MKFFTTSLIAGSAALALAACSGATEEAEDATVAAETGEVETAAAEASEEVVSEAAEATSDQDADGSSNPIGPMTVTGEE